MRPTKLHPRSRWPPAAGYRAIHLTSFERVGLGHTGAGGVGKTRLAIASAELAEELFVDGVRFVDLSRIREPGLVSVLVGWAVGVRQTGRRPQRPVATGSVAAQPAGA